MAVSTMQPSAHASIGSARHENRILGLGVGLTELVLIERRRPKKNENL